MEPHQSSAIHHHKVDLTLVLRPADLFLFYLEANGVIGSDERELIEKSSSTTSDQLLKLLGSLQQNDNGWESIINYLRRDNRNRFADILEKTANERLAYNNSLKPTDVAPKESTLNLVSDNKSKLSEQLQDADAAVKANYNTVNKPTGIQEFSNRLALYYQQHYSKVPTMWEFPKHVKDVWVPLQIDGRQEPFTSANPIDHIELCHRLRCSDGYNVALVKGDPGMGKTTLTKKIAYEWAIDRDSTSYQPYTLVLAVPLRYAGKSSRLDQLAIDYFFSILDMEGIDKTEVTKDIFQLKSQLLVILDGLDEYSYFGESPFRIMFEAPFRQPSTSCAVHPPLSSFKILVTSRPYACQSINDNFWPLRFLILPLDANHLSKFVNLYCQTSQGVVKVTKYLKINAQLVIQVPLILTFVCYLADSVQEIPTNMTCLYYNLMRQMIRREIRQGKLAESVNIQMWKKSNVAQTTENLAFFGFARGQFEFTSDALESCHVTNDSFICGFLLHKYDFAKDLLKAEFPHRSIQEFFAALHCYQLMLAGRKDELGDIRKLIVRDDSQFGRFLFGICSLERQFVRMSNWLCPSLSYVEKLIHWPLGDGINQYGISLSDCSAEESILVGLRLKLSIGDLEDRITSLLYIRSYGSTLMLRNYSHEFKEALHLVDLTRDASGDTVDWCVSDNRQLAQLAVVSRLPKLIEKEFDLVNILMWNTSADLNSGVGWKTILSHISSLPPVRTFIMTTLDLEYSNQWSNTTFIVRTVYCKATGLELANFRFDSNEMHRKEILQEIRDKKLAKLTENRRMLISATPLLFVELDVTVESCDSQSEVIFSLIHLLLL